MNGKKVCKTKRLNAMYSFRLNCASNADHLFPAWKTLAAAAPARKKQKPKGNFLEEKRMQKVRRREEKVLMGPTVVPSVAAAAAAAKYVHVRVMCDPGQASSASP